MSRGAKRGSEGSCKRKSVQRLNKRGLIEVVSNDPIKYKAVLARGEVQESVLSPQTPVLERD